MTANLEAFRLETRAWLAAHCPAEMRTPMDASETPWGGRRFEWPQPQKRWLDAMVSRGWTVPQWPVEYGGGGLSGEQARILDDELARIGARPPLQSFGIWMLGPVLLKYGSEAQKREFLPPIARGEIRWCQGYSEPGAGSDLAGLKTRAEDKGDHYLVNGSKIWTSTADQSDWIFCLVRTDFSAPKHRGISFLLFDMTSPGVTVKPIRLISGYSPFCETFFDNVRVPKRNLVGEPGKGWEIAKLLLDHEREMIGGANSDVIGAGGSAMIGDLAARTVGTKDGKLADEGLRTDIVRYEMDALAVKLTVERLADEAALGAETGAMSSVLKYCGTETNKRRQELEMSLRGVDGLIWGGDGTSVNHTAKSWLRSRANSIEGGTSEIQLNIIAKRLLGLPSA